VHLINTLTIRNGYLAIINDKLVFTASFIKEKNNHLAIKEYELRKDKSLFKLWPLEYIKEVLRRRFVNRKKTVQTTFIHGKSILFEFLDENDL
jgi:5-methylthioribose kinase